MDNLPFILAGIAIILILVLIPALRDLKTKSNKSKDIEATPDFENDSADSCDLEATSDLPSPGALYSEVEADVIGDREMYAQALEIAQSLIVEVRKQIHESGRKANYEVATCQDHDWAVAKVLYSILTAHGWSSIKTGERSYKLSWTAYNSRLNEGNSNLPTHKELLTEVEAEIWENMSDAERKQGRSLAVEMLTQVSDTFRKTGCLSNYWVKIDKPHWLTEGHVRDYIREAGWTVYHEGENSYKLNPDNHTLRTDTDSDLPSPSVMRERIIQEIRGLQTDEEKEEAKNLAKGVIENIREQMTEDGHKLDYTVPIPENVHWLIKRDLIELLGEAGWSAYSSKLNALSVREQNRGFLFI